MSQKRTSLTFRIILPNLDRFSKLFHCSILYLFPSNKVLILFPATFYRCDFYAMWNVSCRKQQIFSYQYRKGQVLQGRKFFNKICLKCLSLAQIKIANGERYRSKMRCYRLTHTPISAGETIDSSSQQGAVVFVTLSPSPTDHMTRT